MENQNANNNLLENLPYQMVVVAIKQLLKQENGIEIFDTLLNIGDFRLIDYLFLAQNKKSLCLMRTRLWLRCLNSMGYDGQTNTFIPANRTFAGWHNLIIEYQKNVIDNCLYTSRVHDLIDCLREGNHLARFLLERLANLVTDPHEQAFLLGRQPIRDRIQLTNDTLSNNISSN